MTYLCSCFFMGRTDHILAMVCGPVCSYHRLFIGGKVSTLLYAIVCELIINWFIVGVCTQDV